ncbi:hypothetical protein CBS101457_001306 [Exobasidium rhododendri]|nr:hypothetical protein CBS101457_001306 [Exobasidium rhododendri]
MAPIIPGRPPGAPRKHGQPQMPSTLSAYRDRHRTSVEEQSAHATSSALPTDSEASNTGLFTMPRVPSSSRAASDMREQTNSNQQPREGTSSWISQIPPAPREHDPSSSAFIDTPTGRQISGPSRNVASTSQTFATPSLARPASSRLYQELTRGIAASRRTKPSSRISTASSGWGSPKMSLGQGIQSWTKADLSSQLDSDIHESSRGPLRIPNGVFDTPRTPSGDHAHLQIPRAPGHHSEASGVNAANLFNHDGSFSVVRNEGDANNSGLLGMSPAVRRNNGLGLGITPARHLNKPPSSSSPLQLNGVASVSLGQSSVDSLTTQGNQSIIEHSSNVGMGGDQGDMEAMRARLLQVDPWDEPMGEDRSAVIDLMRNWREDAMKHHLYDTAIFWGDKILSLESHKDAWNDAYNLATAYFLTHRYAQAEQLLTAPLCLARKPVSFSPEGVEGSDADEDEEDTPRQGDREWNDLDEAIAATHKSSTLPSSMLAKMDGVDFVAHGPDEEIAVTSTFAGRKRKDRQFTISGTGTGSEGTSGEGGSNNEECKENDGVDPMDMGEQVMQAWKEEQRVAMDEVREREILPPDSISLVKVSVACKYLAAQCMARQEKYQEALDELSGWKNDHENQIAMSYGIPSKDGLIKLVSSIWHLKGLIHLKLRNIDEAREDFIKSLSLDVKNYDSFDQLIRGNLLTSSEQWSLIEGLQFVNQAGDDPVQLEALLFLQMMYKTRLDKTGKLHAQQAAAARRQLIRMYGLNSNADVLLGLAEEMFSRMKYEDAYTVAKRIMEVSKDHEASLPIYISTMYMIERLRPTLFLVAHYLTEVDPNLAAAWYAVGCWYLGTKQYLEARKYFSKSVQMDPRFAPGWIAFAHTFSFEGESDQAIVSYSTAERFFSSNHLIKLFIGMEHLNQANLSLAEIYLQGSAQLWEEDPLSRNERGVVQYYKGNYEEAISLFQGALQAAKDVQQPQATWSTTHLNLGFAYRRLKETQRAKKSFLQVIELDPDCSTAHMGLGMCYHREGNLSEAIDWYHRALTINTTDKQTSELLGFALQESAKSIDLPDLMSQQEEELGIGSFSPGKRYHDIAREGEWIASGEKSNESLRSAIMDEDLTASAEMEEESL